MARASQLVALGALVGMVLFFGLETLNSLLSDVDHQMPNGGGPDVRLIAPPASSSSSSAVSVFSIDESTRLLQIKEEAETAEEEAEFKRSGKRPKTRVCTIALNPRQGSLFRTNYLGEMGSGRYRYVSRSSECPWDWPRVRLISYVVCCTKKSQVKRAVNAANDEYDIIIITGDEYCQINDARAHYRQYHGTKSMALSKPQQTTPEIESGFASPLMMNSNQYPMFIPLGPREEFLQERIRGQYLPASQRKYVYNFLGSMTSPSRAILRSVLLTGDLAKQQLFPSFLHITDKWHLKVTKSNGYIEPDQYKRVLMNSIFTLCPTGHNPEAYRIYEALEAGSIPILGLDKYYRQAKCHDAFRPFMDAQAPFVYLKGGWQELEEFLSTKGSNTTWVEEQQQQCKLWYEHWMKQTALRFEALMDFRFQKRMQRGKTSAASGAAADLHLDETLAVRQEEDKDGGGGGDAGGEGEDEEEEDDNHDGLVLDEEED